MNSSNRKLTRVVAIANQKGGVGKTTTTLSLAHALTLQGERVLVIDLDPQGNATQGLGVKLEQVGLSMADLIRDRSVPTEAAVLELGKLSLIPATPLLARVEREMMGLTNSEMRLGHRLRSFARQYSTVLIDTPPTFGPLMNTGLNAAGSVIIPVDSGFFALLGIKELLGEIEEIRAATNPNLAVLGYLLTLSDHTKMTQETWDGMQAAFGEQVFETRIRRSVKLREAPALGRSIFDHDPQGASAQDYLGLCGEVSERLERLYDLPTIGVVETASSVLSSDVEVNHV